MRPHSGLFEQLNTSATSYHLRCLCGDACNASQPCISPQVPFVTNGFVTCPILNPAQFGPNSSIPCLRTVSQHHTAFKVKHECTRVHALHCKQQLALYSVSVPHTLLHAACPS